MAPGESLSPKQAAFCQFVAGGSKQTDAYISAYNVQKMSRPAASTEASKLMKIPKVKDRVDALKADSVIARRAQDKLTAEWIVQKLRQEASDTNNNSSTRVRALEILAKTEGLFSDNSTVIVDNRSVEDIELALRTRLGELFGPAN